MTNKVIIKERLKTMNEEQLHELQEAIEAELYQRLLNQENSFRVEEI